MQMLRERGDFPLNPLQCLFPVKRPSVDIRHWRFTVGANAYRSTPSFDLYSSFLTDVEFARRTDAPGALAWVGVPAATHRSRLQAP
jgi:hypothetical protein